MHNNIVTIMWMTEGHHYYYNVYYSRQDQPELFIRHNSLAIEDNSSSVYYNVTNLEHNINYTIRVEMIYGVSGQKCEIENITLGK